jgi:hypothetical protein
VLRLSVKGYRARIVVKTAGAVARLPEVFNFAIGLCAANDGSSDQTQNAESVGSKRQCTPYAESKQASALTLSTNARSGRGNESVSAALRAMDNMSSFVGMVARDRNCISSRLTDRARLKYS